MHYIGEITFTKVADNTDSFKEEYKIKPDILSIKLH